MRCGVERYLMGQNWCKICREEVNGNVRPEEEVEITCGRCTAGQALYVKNNPDDYPIPEPPKKKRGFRLKDKFKGTTLSDC